MRTPLVVFVILLAGCSATEPADDEPVLEDLAATSTTGILRCVVVDSAIIPLADVLVITDNGEAMRTGTDGECGFDGLEPGPHTISFAKIGYVSSMLTLHVDAGNQDPDTARIQLEADPLTTPKSIPFHFRGHITCATSYTSACGMSLLSDYLGDNSVSVITLDETPLWLAIEGIWTGSQPTQDEMTMNVGPYDGETGPPMKDNQGTSPIPMSLAQWTLRDLEMEGDIYVRLYPWEINGTNIEETTGYCAVLFCHGPGVALQQDFEVIAHAFYNWLPDPKYQFTVDGEPEPPR